ncbi:MAG: hypothetical protein QOK21_1771 [Solirubrobacteraceae bacterium]|jgi:hypothetical protein|nr:hypothetical protein [Solirubrobacteraceae bacterium]
MSRLLPISLLRPLFIALAALALSAGVAQAYPHVSGASVPDNPANAKRLLATPVEDSVYDAATHCDSHTRPGMLDLQHWLEHHVRGVFWGSYRCEKWGRHSASLHAENRAIDWHLSVHSAVDRRAAANLIALLLAPDRNGSPQALARRMGVEEIIWNCGYWGAGMSDFKPYSPCFTPKGKPDRPVDDTTAHRDHVHLGMTYAGAAARTSFWR